MKNKYSVNQPRDKKNEERKRDIAFRILTVIGVSLLLGIILRVSKIDDFNSKRAYRNCVINFVFLFHLRS